MQGSGRQRLHARLGRGEGWVALRLEGVVDEHNGLDELLDSLGAGPAALLIDLGRVRRINSVGVRDWVGWLRRARERFAPVVLYDCTPAVMNEVNLVRNFAEGALITTFKAPYYCDRCGAEGLETLDALALRRAEVREAPAFPCGKPACANALDDADETYFAFLDDQQGIPIPKELDPLIAAARRALDGAAPTPAQPTAGAASVPAERANAPVAALHSALAARAEAAPARVAPPQRVVMPDVAPTPPPPTSHGKDLVFIAIVIAMFAILAVLVYLITTLE
ncbi:MAG: STAS domain-containing protein [Deltaproteobacteria bacterium]|nr:STAS domain-containing protein [Deltaproteobacteria bacterium]